jgi:hypothetical protein
MTGPTHCARLMQLAINHHGDVRDPEIDAALADHGEPVCMPCPACLVAGKPHVLAIRKTGSGHVVTPVERRKGAARLLAASGPIPPERSINGAT